MYARPRPPLSWIAPGHQSTLAPARSSPSREPSSTTWLITAWQLPSGELGTPRKLHPQPGSQLQNSRYVPRILLSATQLIMHAWPSGCAGRSGNRYGIPAQVDPDDLRIVIRGLVAELRVH